MLEGSKFVISFIDLIDGPLGTVLGADKRSDNYYVTNSEKETMCCNCDKDDDE